MQIRTATAGEQRERGIWWNAFPIDGYRVLVAVDSRGNERKRVVLRPGVDPVAAARWLEDVLDRLDPVPKPLQLVRDTTPSQPRRPVDPRMENQLSHAMRVFSRNVRRFRRLDEMN